MKKFIFYLVCLGFFFPTISAMHEPVHEETPTARAIAIPKDHQFYGDDAPPVAAKASLAHNGYVQATSEAVPLSHETATSNAAHAQPATSIHFNELQESDIPVAIAIPDDAFEGLHNQSEIIHDANGNVIEQHQLLDYNESVVAQPSPVIIYDSNGNISSEHYTRNGIEINKIYEPNGDTISTVLDKNKTKRQETTVTPTHGTIEKFYNQKGQLTSTTTINPDGSRVMIKNNEEGNIIASQVHNKIGQLEGSSQLNNYGNRRTTIYNADDTTTGFIYSPEKTLQQNDGTTITQSTDSYGNIASTTKDHNGIVVSKQVKKTDGSHEYMTYDTQGNTLSTTIFSPADDNGNILGTEKNSQGNILSTIKIKTDADGVITKLQMDPQGKILHETIFNAHETMTSRTIFNLDGSEEHSTFDPATGNITMHMITNPDTSGTLTFYDPTTEKTISTTTSTIDANGYKTIIVKNAHNDVTSAVISTPDGIDISESTFNADGSKDVTQYDSSNATIQLTSHIKTDIEGNIISTTKNPQGKITETRVQHKDGTLEYIDYDEHEKPISKTVFALDGTSSIIAL